MVSSSDDSELKIQAERLKTIGNTHYANGDLDSAYKFYTQAIAKSPQSPVYYANRAAALIAQKDYVNASADCRKAVTLNPGYVKAWIRLGFATEALAKWSEASNAYQTALRLLPAEDMSPAEKDLHAQCRKGLKKITGFVDKMPWELANNDTVRARVFGRKEYSCVGVMCEADEGVSRGMTALYTRSMLTSGPNHRLWGYSQSGVTRELSNSVVCDARVFFTDKADFAQMYKMNSCGESQVSGGWLHEEASVEFVRQNVIRKLRTGPLKDAMNAIIITVRGWIFDAYYRSEHQNQLCAGNERYWKALELLKWGRKRFDNLSRDEKGSIWDTTFIRGTQRLLLDNMRTTIEAHGTGKGYTLEAIVEVAEEVIKSVREEESTVRPNDPSNISLLSGHYTAFSIYPQATAYASLGFVHLTQARNTKQNLDLKQSMLETATESYASAAHLMPKDDPLHSEYLYKQLECLCQSRKPLGLTLPLCARIRMTSLSALEVWGNTRYAASARQILESVTQYEAGHRRDILEGISTMDSVFDIALPKSGNVPPTNNPEAEEHSRPSAQERSEKRRMRRQKFKSYVSMVV